MATETQIRQKAVLAVVVDFITITLVAVAVVATLEERGGGNFHTPTYTGGGGGSYNSGSNQQNTPGINQGHGKIIITLLGSFTTNETPSISQGAGPISKVIPEDSLTTWVSGELNATDLDTNSAQLAWSILVAPSHGTAIVDGNGSSPQTFTYQPNANYHGSDSFSVMVSDGDANDSITINLTINPVDDPAIISGDFNQTIQEDNSASGTIIASDIDGLTDGSYFAISTPRFMVFPPLIPWMVTGHTSPTLISLATIILRFRSPMTSISPPSKSSIFSFNL